MTAIGLALIVVGWLIVNVCGSPFRNSSYPADYIGGTTLIIGIGCLLFGVVKFLWANMP